MKSLKDEIKWTVLVVPGHMELEVWFTGTPMHEKGKKGKDKWDLNLVLPRISAHSCQGGLMLLGQRHLSRRMLRSPLWLHGNFLICSNHNYRREAWRDDGWLFQLHVCTAQSWSCQWGRWMKTDTSRSNEDTWKPNWSHLLEVLVQPGGGASSPCQPANVRLMWGLCSVRLRVIHLLALTKWLECRGLMFRPDVHVPPVLMTALIWLIFPSMWVW